LSISKVHSHYENLKVARNAPLEVIRAAYRVLAQKHHPDINDSADASRVMRLLNEAWETLSDPERRAAHDKWIHEEESKFNREPPPVERKARVDTGWTYSTTENQASNTEKPAGNSAPSATSGKKKTNSADTVRSHRGTWAGRQPHAPTEGWRASEQGGLWQRKWAVLLLLVLVAGSLGWWVIAPKTLPSGNKARNSAMQQDAVRESKPVTPQQPNLRTVKTSSGTTYWVDIKPGDDIDSVVAELERNEKNQAREKRKVNNGTGTRSAASINPDPDARQNTGYLDSVRGAGGGLSTFTVDNTQGSRDVVARLYVDGKLPAVRSFLVKQGNTFTVRNLAPGTFVLRYRYIGSEDTYEADRSFVLKQTEDETGTRYSNMTVTLYGVTDGNLRTKLVSKDAF
jgi:hypothetical protein